MFRIRRFGVVKTANLAAVMYVFIILIFVIPIALIAIAAGAGAGGSRSIGGVAAGGGILLFGAIAAVIYGIAGWVFTAIFCLIYNFVAGWTGGIEVEVERVEPVAPQLPATWGTDTLPPAQQPPAQQPPAEQPLGPGPGAPPSQPPPSSVDSG